MKLPFPLTRRTARTTTVAIASAAATAALTIPGLALAGRPWRPRRQRGRAAAARRADQGQPDPEHRPGQDGDQGLLRRHRRRAPSTRSTARRAAPFSPTSAYAQQTEGIADKAEHFLAKRAHHGKWKVHVKHAKHQDHAKPAILFDIDDTTLNTYSYEIYSSFVYNPTTNAAFVNAGSATVFPAVPGMVDLEQKALPRATRCSS